MMTGNRTGRDKQLREKTDSPNPWLQADHSLRGLPSPQDSAENTCHWEKNRDCTGTATRTLPQVPEKVHFPKICSPTEDRHTPLYLKHPSQNENYFAGSHKHICNLLCNTPLLGSRAGHCLCHCLLGTSHYCSVSLAK